MAPIIKSTVQFLMGYAQIYRPVLETTKPTNPCPNAQGHLGESSSTHSPSLSTISWGYNRLDVYGNDYNTGAIAHKYWDGHQWGPSVSEFELLGGTTGTVPSAVSDNANSMAIFIIDDDGSLQYKHFDGHDWKPSSDTWYILKAEADADHTFAPSTTSWAPARLDTFYKGAGGSLKHVYYDGSSWGPNGEEPEDLGGEMASGPAAVSWGEGRNDVFALDPDGNLVHIYWDGTRWSDWESFVYNISFVATPNAVSWGENRLDVLAVNADGKLSHLYWDGHQWSPFEDLGGDFLIGTVAATTSPSRIDIVALGQDGQYYYKYFDGNSWQPSVTSWYPKGGDFSSSPSVVSWLKDANQRLDIFGVTAEGQLKHQTWYGSGWYPGANEWEALGDGLVA